jgi:hypothetical protein
VKRILFAVPLVMLVLSSAIAQETCDSRAVTKSGKPLVGAASMSLLHKCKRDTCEAKAIGSNGRKLSGAAKQSFIKKCETSA